jgi:hypothetical protein
MPVVVLDLVAERIGQALVGLLGKQPARLNLENPLRLSFRHCLGHRHLVDQAAVG